MQLAIDILPRPYARRQQAKKFHEPLIVSVRSKRMKDHLDLLDHLRNRLIKLHVPRTGQTPLDDNWLFHTSSINRNSPAANDDPRKPTTALYRMQWMPRIFLISPARCDGKRAQLLLRDQAPFDLAKRLRGPEGATIGEVFSFLSGLYFRGKLAYATTFATPATAQDAPGADESAGAGAGAYVITTNRGLLPAHQRLTLNDLRQLSRNSIHVNERRYRQPLERSAAQLKALHGDDCDWVLLGSVASGKYVDILTRIFADRLRFPADFVGRGDMSRGGLMLRCVQDRRELAYIPVSGAVRNGKRPPKLAPRPGILATAAVKIA
jgi:hypothetical protein